MKTNCWLILGTVLATTAVAQVNTNKLPEIPPPAATLPAAPAPVVAPAPTQTAPPVKKAATKAKKKSARKAKPAAKPASRKTEKKGPELPVTLVPGPATVDADHVNLRGQAGLQGEVVGHVQKGETVNVLSEITLDKPKAGEPAQWAKIALPAGTKVWVDSKFIDTSNNVVSVKKLNLRGGPGENYSVLGVIEKGTSITPVTTKGDWMQIETPANAFAFMAASYLKQEGPGMQPITPPVATTTEAVPPPPAPVTPPPAIPPTQTTVAEQQPLAPPATAPPPTPESAAPATPMATPTPTLTPTPTPGPATPTVGLPTPTLAPEDTNQDTNLPPRIVTHEGTVRRSISPVAPTYYELYNPVDNKAIDYLYSPSTNLNLARYNGLHITVTGEEGLDPRWQDTPVITIQKIYVLSKDVPLKPVSSPSNTATNKHAWYHFW